MTMKTRFHLFLHVGCVTLLLVQGHRIQQFRTEKVESITRERKVRMLLWRVIHMIGPEGTFFFDPDCSRNCMPTSAADKDCPESCPSLAAAEREAIKPVWLPPRCVLYRPEIADRTKPLDNSGLMEEKTATTTVQNRAHVH
jgi:hypothetical protein